MSFMFCYGDCVRCHKPFSFNPERVPSVVVNGSREPLCADCVAWANPLRVAKGLPPIQVLSGAYEPEEVAF